MREFKTAQATVWNRIKVMVAALPLLAALIVFVMALTKSLPSLAATQ